MKTFFRSLIIILAVGLVGLGVLFFDFGVQVPPAVDQTKEKKSVGAGIIRNEQVDSSFSNIGGNNEFSGQLDDIISLANEARKEKGIAPLQKNDKLMASALSKARDMEEKNYFEHISPEGLQPWFFIEQAGYKYKTVGENLAEGYFSAESVHNAWMNSEGHRENILSSEFEEIGVAVVEIEKNGFHSFLSVQHFGTALKPEDLKVLIVCDLDSKEQCEDIEKKREDVKDAIEKQEEIIEDAKDQGSSDKDLHKLYENLDYLEQIKDDLKDYLKECDEFIEKCDKWK